MNEINIYLTDLVAEGRLTYPEAEIFLDNAYDMVLNDESIGEIESQITQMVEEHLNSQNENDK